MQTSIQVAIQFLDSQIRRWFLSKVRTQFVPADSPLEPAIQSYIPTIYLSSSQFLSDKYPYTNHLYLVQKSEQKKIFSLLAQSLAPYPPIWIRVLV